MTATVEEEQDQQEGGVGRISRVIGPVVDVEFSSEEMPEIFNALHVERSLGDQTDTIALEVSQHIGDNMVRCVSLAPADGLVRGAEVQDTGGPITVPVGDVTKGHVFNALGVPLDIDASSLEIKERGGIPRPAPPFDELEAKTEMFVTGIKVIDLLAPFVP